MQTIDIASYLRDTAQKVQQQLDNAIPEIDLGYFQLFKAARYSVLSSGKMLRPALALATAETFGAPPQKALCCACALEMIHTYSLIHDDLPCMDDDDFRRGKPSLHKAFGEGLAVLTGDYLLTYAFEVVARDENLTPTQRNSLIVLLARNSGAHGMIGGQVMDIEAEGLNIDLAALQEIHKCKTGALITAAILCGGVVGNASEHEMEALTGFGNEIGLAFQIIDDVIDVTASEEKHGKSVASDAANGKTTYVTLLGIDGAQQAADACYTRALSYLNEIQRDTSLLQALAECLVYRKR